MNKQKILPIITAILLLCSLLTIIYIKYENKEEECSDNRICKVEYIGFDRMPNGEWHKMFYNTESKQVIVGERMQVDKQTLDKLFKIN